MEAAVAQDPHLVVIGETARGVSVQHELAVPADRDILGVAYPTAVDDLDLDHGTERTTSGKAETSVPRVVGECVVVQAGGREDVLGQNHRIVAEAESVQVIDVERLEDQGDPAVRSKGMVP